MAKSKAEKIKVKELLFMQLNELLHKILSTVNESLKFAEAKNATLLAANCGTLIAISTKIKSPLPTCVLIATGILSIAIFCCLVSFVPRIERFFIGKIKPTSINDNVLFFGEIAKHDIESFLQILAQKANLNNKGYSGLDKDYADQIIINSRIAVQKYKLFTFAMWATLLSIAAVWLSGYLPMAIQTVTSIFGKGVQ
ncbi:MAG: Pycsar system effector family protein [Candidatus Melainabacteria bacterium]|jgi:hypothetical protein